MTIVYSYDGHEKKICCESPYMCEDTVEDLKRIGAEIIDITCPPPGTDDRKPGETATWLGGYPMNGVKCYVGRDKDGKYYRFTVPGWSEVKVNSKKEALRVIRGRFDAATMNTMGRDWCLVH